MSFSANARYTIHAIIHPFQSNEMQEKNMDFYKKIIAEVIENRNSFLYYVATQPDIHGSSNDQEGYDFTKEADLQSMLWNQPNEVYRRMAIFTDKEGYYSWYVPGYSPRGFIDIVSSLNPVSSPLFLFAQKGAKTYYTSELARAYTDISGLTKNQRSEMEERLNAEFLVAGTKAFLSVPLHPQVAKLIRFLGIRQESIEGRYLFTLDNEEKRNINIIASGENLEEGVFREAMRLAILLGIPLEHVSLNREQPYLPEREKERAYFRRPPIEALYPPEYYREYSSRGRLR